jgi:opacity protein-like surface antigen
MVRARLKISMLVMLCALASSVARAADYSQPLPPPPPIYVQPQPQFAEGWYLRGDIGFSNQQVGSIFNKNYNRYDSVQNTYKSFDAAPFFGLGIGYNVNSWFRVDVTGEYRANANFKGEDIACASSLSPNCQPDVYTGSKSEWTFLLNGYVDLGTWSNFTPFVGAGIGMSRNTISNFTDTNVVPNAVATGDTASKWDFAWALYAGVGYRVTRNLTLELAYRYIDLGNATTGTMNGFCCGATDTPYEFRHLTSHDVKLGMRFNFDSEFETPVPVRYYAPPQVYAPPPPVYAPQPPLSSRG